MRTLNGITKRTAVNCKNRNEVWALFQILDHAGYTWCHGERYTTENSLWERYGSRTCYTVLNGGITQTDELGSLESNHSFDFMSAIEFVELNGDITDSPFEYSKPEEEWPAINYHNPSNQTMFIHSRAGYAIGSLITPKRDPYGIILMIMQINGTGYHFNAVTLKISPKSSQYAYYCKNLAVAKYTSGLNTTDWEIIDDMELSLSIIKQ